MSDPWLTVAAVARQLNVRPRFVYALLRRRALAGVRLGRLWRIEPRALATFVAAHTQAVAPALVDDRQLVLFEAPPRIGLAEQEESP